MEAGAILCTVSGDRVIVGVCNGNSDVPGVVEDLDDVICYDADWGHEARRFPHYGSVPIAAMPPLSDGERAFYVMTWAESMLRDAERDRDQADAALRDAEAAVVKFTAAVGTVDKAALAAYMK